MKADSLKTLFGKKFRNARESRKLSRAALAMRLGISPKTIQSWEMGRTFIENLSLIPSIEKELGLTFTSLITEQAEEGMLAAESAAAYGASAAAPAVKPKPLDRVVTGPQAPTFVVSETDDKSLAQSKEHYIAVPLLKPSSAALPVADLKKKDIVKQCLFPAEWCPRGRVLVAFLMTDSALAPHIPQGSMVLVDRRVTSPERLNGRFAAIWLGDRGLRIRRIHMTGTKVEGLPAYGKTRGKVGIDTDRGDQIIGRIMGICAPLA